MKKSILYFAAVLVGLAIAAVSLPTCYAGSTKGELLTSAPKDYKTVIFEVSMHCENCVKKINENISFEKGVKDLEVSLEGKVVTITYDPAKTDESTLKAAIEKLGYKVSIAD